MLRHDLYEAMPFEPLPAVFRRLPMRLEPHDGEALISWLYRLAGRLKLRPRTLLNDVLGLAPESDRNWWCRPDACRLTALAGASSLSIDQLRATTLLDWGQAFDDEYHERLSAARWLTEPHTDRHGRRFAICTQCLAEDREPWLRLSWFIGLTSICPRHRTVLLAQCPACLRLLRAPNDAYATDIPDVAACAHCGTRLAGLESPEADTRALDVQEALLRGKRSGEVHLPGAGCLEWPVAMALIDMLMRLIWPRRQEIEIRRTFFEGIAADLGMKQDEPADMTFWATNYGGMLALAWLFGDYRSRLVTTRVLTSPKGRIWHLLKRMDASMEPSHHEALREQLACLKRKRVRRKPSSQVKNLQCVVPSRRRTLPIYPHGPQYRRTKPVPIRRDSAALREIARNARSDVHRNRYLAIADIQDGVSLDRLIEKNLAAPKVVYGWWKRYRSRPTQPSADAQTRRK